MILTKYVFPTSFITSIETKKYLKNMLVEQGPLTKDEIIRIVVYGKVKLVLFDNRKAIFLQ